jgi:hypothetical protein
MRWVFPPRGRPLAGRRGVGRGGLVRCVGGQLAALLHGAADAVGNGAVAALWRVEPAARSACGVGGGAR